MFKDGVNQVTDHGTNLRFLYDTGTNFTSISSTLAQSLGLSGKPSEFQCTISGTTTLNGYQIDAIQMTGYSGDTYTVTNARICVDADPAPFGGVADARIGSNLFEQVPVLFNGDSNTLMVLSDLRNGDLNKDGCVDKTDYQLLMSKLKSLSQRLEITGYTEVGYDSSIGINYFTVQFTESTGKAPIKLKSATYDFTGLDVQNGYDGTQIVTLPMNLKSGKKYYTYFNLDKKSIGTGTPLAQDYLGGKVLLKFSDAPTFTTTFDQLPNPILLNQILSAGANFKLHTRLPTDPSFDINRDGKVTIKDASGTD